jgi:non-heme chloroperoxidase
MDTYSDDLAKLVEALDLKDAIHVGHSTGGGEVARYIGRHGTKRVAKAVLIGAVPPLMLKTAAHPGGLPMEAFDGIRAGVLADRSQFFKDLASGPFFGFNRPGAKVSQGMIDSFWMQGLMAGFKGAFDCIKARRTSPKISRSSTCPRSSCTATTIRLCQSARRRCFRPSWLRARG